MNGQQGRGNRQQDPSPERKRWVKQSRDREGADSKRSVQEHWLEYNQWHQECATASGTKNA